MDVLAGMGTWCWERVRALEAILHVDIDLTAFSGPSSAADCTPTANVEDRRRKFIQAQRVVDCVNAGRILSEEKYESGKALPLHLSPFGEDKEEEGIWSLLSLVLMPSCVLMTLGSL